MFYIVFFPIRGLCMNLHFFVRLNIILKVNKICCYIWCKMSIMSIWTSCLPYLLHQFIVFLFETITLQTHAVIENHVTVCKLCLIVAESLHGWPDICVSIPRCHWHTLSSLKFICLSIWRWLHLFGRKCHNLYQGYICTVDYNLWSILRS